MNAALPGWPHAVPAFHDGETDAQRRAGLDGRLAEVGRHVMRAEMPAQHRALFEELPFIVVGALDAQGRPWASAVAGAPGLVRSPDARTLEIGGRPLAADALGLRLAAGDPLALLGLQPETRRRNRANGVLGEAPAGRLRFEVRQSFGNCPKYIVAHELQPVLVPPAPVERFGRWLPAAARAMLAQADTVYLASASADAGRPGAAANEGLDVSHRGGPKGFVTLQAGEGEEGEEEGADVLRLPDYPGNFFFNTVGNLLRRPQAGLLAIDRRRGDVLMLTAAASVEWQAQGRGEAPRALRFVVEAGAWLPGAWPLRERLDD